MTLRTDKSRRRVAYAVFLLTFLVWAGTTAAWAVTGDEDYRWGLPFAAAGLLGGAILSPPPTRPRRKSRLDAWRGGPTSGDGAAGGSDGSDSSGGCGGGGCGGGGS